MKSAFSTQVVHFARIYLRFLPPTHHTHPFPAAPPKIKIHQNNKRYPTGDIRSLSVEPSTPCGNGSSSFTCSSPRHSFPTNPTIA